VWNGASNDRAASHLTAGPSSFARPHNPAPRAVVADNVLHASTAWNVKSRFGRLSANCPRALILVRDSVFIQRSRDGCGNSRHCLSVCLFVSSLPARSQDRVKTNLSLMPQQWRRVD